MGKIGWAVFYAILIAVVLVTLVQLAARHASDDTASRNPATSSPSRATPLDASSGSDSRSAVPGPTFIDVEPTAVIRVRGDNSAPVSGARVHLVRRASIIHLGESNAQGE